MVDLIVTRPMPDVVSTKQGEPSEHNSKMDFLRRIDENYTVQTFIFQPLVLIGFICCIGVEVTGMSNTLVQNQELSNRHRTSRSLDLTEFAGSRVKKSSPETQVIAGKPVCGEFAALNLENGGDFRLHMPWNVAVRMKEGKESSISWGTIVQSNAVLTVTPQLSIQYLNSNSSLPPTNIQVVITSSDGSTKFVDVLKVIPPDDNCGLPEDPVCSVILLVLRQPISQTPACLDLARAKLPELMLPQLGVVESMPQVGSPDTKLHVVPYIERKDCRGRVRETGHFPQGIYCVGPLNENSGTLWNGAGFVTQNENAWYLRGLTVFNWKARNETLTGIYITVDLEDNLLPWLDKALKSAENSLEIKELARKEERVHDLSAPPNIVNRNQPESPIPDHDKGQEGMSPGYTALVAIIGAALVLTVILIVWAIVKKRPGAGIAATFCCLSLTETITVALTT